MAVHTPLLRPGYAERFRCIGPNCEDSCCAGWTVIFDQPACQKYETVPPGPLRVLLDTRVLRQPLLLDGSAPIQFAKVQMTEENICPFLNGEKLCEIQAQQGESYLSVTCASFPRVAHKFDGLEEKALSLACPEAARLVLLSPDLMQTIGPQYQMLWDDSAHASDLPGAQESPHVPGPAGVWLEPSRPGAPVALISYFWPVREFVLNLIANRDYALWQRLFLIGVFVRQLDGLARGDSDRRFGAVLSGFKAAITSGQDSGGLCAKMNAIQPDLRLQLDMVLRLAGLRLPRKHVGQRFVEIIGMFTQGIGHRPEATMESLIDSYAGAYRQFYKPFFALHPHILENLLVNSVFSTLFPYGPNLSSPDWSPRMERQFCFLGAYFGLIKGLLIGVAGCRREAFCVEDVVLTVQAASKHFEHHPAFLDQAHTLLAAAKLDNLRGLTMLLRN